MSINRDLNISPLVSALHSSEMSDSESVYNFEFGFVVVYLVPLSHSRFHTVQVGWKIM